EDSGLYIVRHNSKKLTEDIVREMVLKGRGMSPEIEDATLRHLLSGDSEIVLVRGEKVLPTLRKVVGDKTNPNMCNEDTVRYIFGDHNPEKLDAGATYFRNAAHRPTDLEEQKKDKINFTRFT
ncbi:MAG: hypothetical protein M1459_01865, partial [Patescibacteria group bacterium]|nr:hypothetical protein [Patescibacteria group bacterium]